MKFFLSQLTTVLTEQEKRKFWIYILVLFIGSMTSVLGIGAVIPFITILIEPSKFTKFDIFNKVPHTELMAISSIVLVLSFWIKNFVAALIMKYQLSYINDVVQSVQTRLFSHYMNLSYEEHITRDTSKLINNLSGEVEQFSYGVLSPFGQLISDIFAVFFVLLVLLYINLLFTTIVIGVLCVSMMIFMRLIKSKIHKYSQNRIHSAYKIKKHILDGLKGIKETKLYHREKSFINQFTNDASLYNKVNTQALFYSQVQRLILEVVALSVVMVTIMVFILLGISSTKIFILLSVFGFAAAQLLPSLNRITGAITQIKYSYPALQVIATEMQGINLTIETTASDNDHNINFVHKITLRDISYKYKHGRQVLDDINIEICRGQKIAFIGRSGAGKTTLVDLLIGLYQPTSGMIQIDGVTLENSNSLAYQKLFGYIPQQIILYNDSVKNNIAFGITLNNIDEVRIWECLRLAKIDDIIRNLPHGLDTVLGESGMILSGGQRQRLGIARALYQNPAILVMDEATSALDNETEHRIVAELASLSDLTTITIAHRLSTVRNYDKLIVLDTGRVVAFGDYNELMQNSTVFREISLQNINKDE